MSAQYAAALHSFSRPFKVAYPARSQPHTILGFEYVKAHWKKISTAAAVGILAGFIAGVVSSRAGLLFTEVVYAAAPAAAPSALTLKPPPPIAFNEVAQQELARLRAQNEQLQTTVAELRKESPQSRARRAKSHHRKHARHA